MMPDRLPPDDPATGPSALFAGREDLFHWLAEQLAQGASDPLLIIGPAQMGKTAVLQQIQNGRLGPAFFPLYLDFARLQRGSPSILLHDMAQTAVAQLRAAGISLPEPRRSDFVINPGKVFVEQIIQPALARLDGRKLLLLGDNLHLLLDQMTRQTFVGYTFDTFYRLFHDQTNVCTLFTLNTENQSFDLPLFTTMPTWELGPLTPEEVAAYLRWPTPVTMVKDVSDYIYKVSGGRPADLAALRQAIVDWKARYGLRRLTVADVNAVYQEMTLGKTAVIRQTPEPFLITRPAPPERANYRSPYRATSIGRGALLLGSAIFLLAVALLTTTLLSQAQARPPEDNSPPPDIAETAVRLTSEALAAAILSQTPTTTPTKAPTPTPTPTDTPSPSPTPTNSPTPRPTRTPIPERLPETRLREIDAMPLRLIPAGTFMMGSEPEDRMAASDERPLHAVTLNDFYIDQYEVSVAQYAAFLNRLGTYRQACNGFDCTMPRQRVGLTSYLLEEEMGTNSVLYTPLTGFGNYPANFISWHGAVAYCEAMGARLPTEAEWEYAARGSDGRMYPWGNEAPNELRAVFNSSNFDNLKPVNALPNGQSPFGVFGMAGGVWEWVADWYDENYYATSPEFNPVGPELGITRSIRGGAWPLNNEADRIRSANRSAAPPETTSASIGFRCAQDP